MPQNRGYFLGRLFALLARQEALERAPEQLFQLASTSPPQVFPKALATLIEAGKEEELFSIMSMLNIDAFDGGLNRREQGAFALGYIHERTGYVLPQFEEDVEDEEMNACENI
jgi:CRISPR-associated protein (Cas_Csd1)